MPSPPLKNRLSSVLSLLLVLVPRGALADDGVPSPEPTEAATSTFSTPSGNGPGWAFGSPWGEVGLAAASLLSMTTAAVPQQSSSWGPAATRPPDPVWSHLSDVTGAYFGTGLAMLSGVGLEYAYYRGQGEAEPLARALRTSLEEAEAVAMTTGATMLLKSLTGRCRPRAYDGTSCVGGEFDAFPSGHTSPVAAVAGVRLVHAIRSPGPSTARYVSFALAEAASVLTGALRVGAGAHSWDDVVAGWGLGHAIGALIAVGHPWPSRGAPPVRPAEIAGAASATELPSSPMRAPTIGGSLSFEF